VSCCFYSGTFISDDLKYPAVGTQVKQQLFIFTKIINMKLALLFSLVVSVVFAQAQNNIPVFIKADFGPSNVKTNNGKGNSDFALGIGAESYLSIYKEKDYSIALNPVLSYLKTGYESTGGGKVIVNYINLAVPLSLVVNPMESGEEFGLSVGAGPFVGLAASGKFKVLTSDAYKKMSFGNGTADNRRSLDAGLTLKSSIRVSRVNFGTQYNLGLTNLVPKDRVTGGTYIKSRNFLFYISFAINGNKK
jgi:hypothetical protein